MVKQIILIAGLYAVGKSYQCDRWIKDHPEYKLIKTHENIDKLINELKGHDHWIGDYYFAKDWNAEKLKKELNCPVEIWVLFDRPEVTTRRQTREREEQTHSNIDCWLSEHLYTEEFRSLLFLPECRFFDGNMNEYNYDQFRAKYHSFLKPYTKEQVQEYINLIDPIPEYDKYYHHLNLPHGIRIGKDNYARNEETWAIIKDWVDWKDKKVLELACFHGYFSQQIWFRGGNPTACDISREAINSAAVFSLMQGTKFKLYRCDINNEFPQGNHDICMLFNVFHHLKKQPQVLERMQKYPMCIFEINKKDRPMIEQYFKVVREIESPKDNRVILQTKPIKLRQENE